MEPDLIGQEKSPSMKGVRAAVEKPAMEPDLIGQEKSRARHSRRRHHQGPAMEPDLIGQEKALEALIVSSSVFNPQWSLTSSVRKRVGAELYHRKNTNPQWSLTSSVRKRRQGFHQRGPV